MSQSVRAIAGQGVLSSPKETRGSLALPCLELLPGAPGVATVQSIASVLRPARDLDVIFWLTKEMSAVLPSRSELRFAWPVRQCVQFNTGEGCDLAAGSFHARHAHKIARL